MVRSMEKKKVYQIHKHIQLLIKSCDGLLKKRDNQKGRPCLILFIWLSGWEGKSVMNL